jgi:Na+/H+ antiporter NhaD/arsenite permease-like protein
LSREADMSSAQIKTTARLSRHERVQETAITVGQRRYRFLVVAILCLGGIATALLVERILVWGPMAPSTRQAGRWTLQLAGIVIFTISYLGVAVGYLPGFKIDRAGAAFVGASLMVAFGVLPMRDAYSAIDLDTLVLLLGVMIVVAHLRLSGLLQFASRALARRAGHPLTLLTALVALTGILSAFLVNDTICLAMAPLVLDLVMQTNRNPIPYLLAIAMASNIGSAATITGNPQNMIIGSLSHISYRTFTAALWPVAAIGLLLTVIMISLTYRSEFWTEDRLFEDLPAFRVNKLLMLKSTLTCLAMIVAFFAGVAPSRAAIAAGGVLLLSRRLECQKIYQEIQWTLLLMVVGLFIVVGGLEKSIFSPQMLGALERFHFESVPALSVVTGILSNLVSNVPAVLMLKPFVAALRHQQKAWLTIAMASTLAGNFTLPGSVANLIVAQTAQAYGTRIGFWDYFKVGAPLTVMTILVGVFRL